MWSFTNGSGDFLVDTARHSEGADNGPVDVFVASCDDAGCSLFGRTSATDTTRWMVSLPGCSTDGGTGGAYTGLQASGTGNRVAFLCHHVASPGATPTARVYLIGGQSGTVTWVQDLGTGIQAGQGDVSISQDGAWVLFVNEGGKPTPNTATAFIYDGASGVLRDSITIPFFICAAISDSGDYVAVGDDPLVHVWLWDAATAKYKPAYDLTPPSAGSWIPWDVTMSTGTDADEMVVVGYISGDVRTVQVTAWSVVGGTQQINWVSATNAQLQENPSLRADHDYVGVSLWGDDGELPTVVLLKKGSNVPVFSAVTPGSMVAVDLNVVLSAGQADVIYLAAAGKHVPANRMGNGGDAFGWKISQ